LRVSLNTSVLFQKSMDRSASSLFKGESEHLRVVAGEPEHLRVVAGEFEHLCGVAGGMLGKHTRHAREAHGGGGGR
jgi:hypothetical protein